MRLYHTGTMEIRDPDIHLGRKNADFGQGFYLTPDRAFTYRWAGPDSVVNTYELDVSGLRIQRFGRDEDWFRCVFDHRRGRDSLTADVIIGPIANDTIFETYGIVSSGFLKDEEALRLLQIGPEYMQVAIRTEKAKQQLKWLEAERIAQMDPTVKKAEEERYQALFSEAMRKMTE